MDVILGGRMNLYTLILYSTELGHRLHMSNKQGNDGKNYRRKIKILIREKKNDKVL